MIKLVIKMKKEKGKFKFKNKYLPLIIIAIVLLIAVICVFIFKKEPSKNLSNGSKTTTIAKQVKIVNLESKSRPYAVMINNLGTARPLQSGLQDAYIMYELIVEGGITR